MPLIVGIDSSAPQGQHGVLRSRSPDVVVAELRDCMRGLAATHRPPIEGTGRGAVSRD